MSHIHATISQLSFLFFQVRFRITVKPFFDEGGISVLNFSLHANSSNPELTSSLQDNVYRVSIPVIVETELIIRG